MTEFSINRRDLLQMTGAGVLGTAGFSQVGAAEASSGGDKVWEFEANDVVRGSPTVVGETVFAGGDDENLYAINNVDGTERWSYSTSSSINAQIRAAPAVVDDTVYFGTNMRGFGRFYALNATDGSKEWRYKTGSRVLSSPTVVDGTVYVGNNGGTPRDPSPNLYALDADDGSKIWQFQTKNNIQSSPTVIDGTVYIGSNDSSVYAVNATDGTEQWSTSLSQYMSVRSSPTVVNETVYVGLTERDGNSLYALDAETGSVQWKVDKGGIDSSPTVIDGTLYIGSFLPGRIHAVDIDNGSSQWTFETNGRRVSSPTVAGDVVYIGSTDGVLYALDKDDGTNLWTYDTGTSFLSSPIVSDGTLYVGCGIIDCCAPGDGEGTLYAIDVGSETSSNGSRVNLGTLNHNNTFAEKGPTGPGIPDDREPEINATSIDIDPYPVEQGDRPEIRIIVEGADEVEAILEKTDRSAPSTVTLEMEQEAEDQWAATDHSVSFDEIGWWDLRIEAKSGTGESVTLDTFEIDDPRDPDEQEGEWLLEDQELGFHVFEEVADVAVVVGWFADEDPPTDSEVAELSAWFEARERDTNYYFGSKRGMRSLVGFNMELRLFESGEVFEVESREYYEEEVGDDAENEFMQDLKSTAFPSDGLESYDFWIGTNPGGDFGYDNGEHVTDAGGLWIPIRSRAPRRLEDDDIVAGKYIFSYNIWVHEICHAFGFGHPNDIGNQGDTHKCVTVQDADRLEPKNRNPTDEIAPVPPVSTLQYLTRELEFSLDVRPVIGESGLLETSDQIGYQRKDWLNPVETKLEDIDQNYSDRKVIDGLQSYDIGDSVHVLIANTGIFGHKIKYIFESRPLIKSEESTDYGPDIKWSNDQGALVIYKWEEPDTITTEPSYNVVKNGGVQRSLRTPGEEFRDELDDGRVIVFQLDDKQWGSDVGDPSEFSTEVKIKKEPSDSSTRIITLDDPTSIPASLNPSCFAEYTSPSLDLKAIDSEGRIVGINDDGKYLNQIPGAKASGKRVQGTEWISVPEDTDVDFRVSSADVERFIEDMEQLGTLADEPDESDDSVSKSELESKLTREYGVSQTTYGNNPELVEEGGETVVTDATTRVQREEIPPRVEKEATPRNPFSDVDIVAIYPDTESLAEERVVLTNHGTETLDATGWQITNESGNIFVMPEFELNPGEEVAIRTGTGEDTDTDLYRDTEQSQWNPDGGQVQLIDNTGTTILSVTYDDRGVIEYDDTREDDGEPSLADYAGSDDLIHLVGLRDAIDDWRDDIIGDELLNTVVDAWRTERKIEQKEVD
jgi:outer membrane protein assembly factor BamB